MSGNIETDEVRTAVYMRSSTVGDLAEAALNAQLKAIQGYLQRHKQPPKVVGYYRDCDGDGSGLQALLADLENGWITADQIVVESLDRLGRLDALRGCAELRRRFGITVIVAD